MPISAIAGAVLLLLLYGCLSDGHFAIISRRPYNNRHNDASAARDDHLG